MPSLSLTVNRALFYGVVMKFKKCLLVPFLALILSSCAGYRVGSTLDPAVQTVSLTVVNKTDEPSIEVAVKKALLAELQMDGRLEVVSPGNADVELTVTLRSFNLSALGYNRKYDKLVEEYRMTLTASAVLVKTETEEVLLEAPRLQGDGDFPFKSDLTTTKRGVLPVAAADLARKVVSTTVTAW